MGLAAVASEVHRRAVRGREGLLVAAGTLVVAPLLLLPSAAWGLTGDLRPVSFPDEWEAVADEVADGPDGAVVVLPWEGSYRRFGWNDGRATLDPAPRLLPGEVLVDDRIVLDDEVLPGEDPRLAAVTSARSTRTTRARRCAELGVRWVLVEKPLPASYAVPAGSVALDDARAAARRPRRTDRSRRRPRRGRVAPLGDPRRRPGGARRPAGRFGSAYPARQVCSRTNMTAE